MSSRFEDATMGAANARGEEIDEGVDDRVWYVLDGQWYVGTGAGTEDAVLARLSERSSPPVAMNGRGEPDAIGVGSEDAP